jgi:hypothetical protein
MKITSRLLKRLDVCKDGLEFFEKNKLEGFDSEWIKDIPTEIKLNDYVKWLKHKFRDTCKIIEDNDSNELTYRSSNGYSWTRTYDENNNALTYEDSDGFSSTKTYDENNNVLTYADSNGEWWTRPYYENNNELTFEDPDSYVGTYDKDGRLLSVTENDVTFNIPWES